MYIKNSIGNKQRNYIIPKLETFSVLQSTYEGMSGFIKFDRYGHRTNFTLDVMELKRNGLSKVRYFQIYYLNISFFNNKLLFIHVLLIL